MSEEKVITKSYRLLESLDGISNFLNEELAFPTPAFTVASKISIGFKWFIIQIPYFL